MSTKFIQVTRWYPKRYSYIPGTTLGVAERTHSWVMTQPDTTQEVLIKLGDIRLVEKTSVANETILKTENSVKLGEEEVRQVATITLTDGKQMHTKESFEIVCSKIKNNWGHICQ